MDRMKIKIKYWGTLKPTKSMQQKQKRGKMFKILMEGRTLLGCIRRLAEPDVSLPILQNKGTNF